MSIQCCYVTFYKSLSLYLEHGKDLEQSQRLLGSILIPRKSLYLIEGITNLQHLGHLLLHLCLPTLAAIHVLVYRYALVL